MKPEPRKERKQREHGENWHKARRIYLEYPFIPVADLARILGVSLARFNVYIDGLRDERQERCADALQRLKKKEGL